MTQPNPSTALAEVLIDELGRNGVEFFALSPGSRSTALAVAADGKDTTSVVVVIDERSASFWALGRAKATGKPAVVISTSGTAAANFLPAVVEAELSMTPLIVITADRPEEMRGVGANQTIDQEGLYGNHVRFAATVEAPAADADDNDAWRSVVCRAVGEARGSGGMAGAVHLNVAFREPTVPVSDDGRSHSSPYPHSVDGRPDGEPWLATPLRATPRPAIEIPGSLRGLVVAGDGVYDRDALLTAAERLGWPVLGTSLSGLRGRGALSAYHYMLAGGVPPTLQPDVVLVVGRVGPSQRLEGLISEADLRFRVDASGRRIDPWRNATRIIHADPVELLTRIPPEESSDRWSRVWSEADSAVRKATLAYIKGLEEPTGPGIAATLDHCPWDTLVVASSLPIRDVDSLVEKGGRVVGNRGASGIDGFVSTALGVATTAAETLALSGDLSLLHDSNGFLASEKPDLVLVVVDNGGGGLFDLLPQARHAPGYERLFVTPPDRSLERLAQFHEVAYSEVTELSELSGQVSSGHRDGGVSMLRVPVDRQTDLASRHALDEIGRAAAASLEP